MQLVEVALFPFPLVGEGGVGGLRPPFLSRTPMLCIGYAKSVPDEGFRSIDRPRPLTRLRFAKPPSPTRGEGKSRRSALGRTKPLRRPGIQASGNRRLV